MSTEFNSAQNPKNSAEDTANMQKSTAVPRDDSDLDIQELLSKYLPDYADENPVAPQTETVTVQATVEPKTPEIFAADNAVGLTGTPSVAADDEDDDADVIDTAKKAGGLFARLHHRAEGSAENESVEDSVGVAPDSAIFDEIAADMEKDGVTEENPLSIFADDKTREIGIPMPASSVAEMQDDLSGTPAADAFARTAESDAPVTDAEADGAEAADEAPVSDGTAEEDLSAEGEGDANVIDDTDINLMVAFGLEDQLEKAMGTGAADEAAARMDAVQREHDEQKRKAMEYEYTDRAQTPQIAAAYKYALRTLKFKIVAAAVLSLLLFFFENITLFGIQFAGALDPAVYPVVNIMMSLQIMLIVCAIAYEQIFTGFTNLITLRPTPESVLTVLAAFSVLYSVILSFTVVPGEEPVLYNFPVALAALLSLIFSYFNTKREVFSFNIVSSKRPKFVFRRIAATENTPESCIFGATDEDSPDVLRITRTDFVDGYFDRTTPVLHTTRVYIGAMLTAIVAASILMTVFALLSGADGSDAVTVAYLTIIAGIPLSMFFTYSYPFYKANREAYANDSTIVGERSLDEYSGAFIASFEDKNVFPSYSVKVQNIKIYNNNRIDRVLYYAAGAFAAAGGPLSDVFDLATMEMDRSDNVELLTAGVGYLEAAVDGRRILFGRSDVLTELGYDIPVEVVEEDSYVQGDLSIMYMLRDGNLIAKMYIRYVMDADFEFILRQFARGGTCVAVKTFDPNIDEEMIFSKVRGKKYPLKVVRNLEGCESAERVDSGIVARGTTKSLLQVVSYCDMVLSVKNTNLIISIVSAIVSLAIVFIVMLSNNLGALHSWMIAVNHLFWMIPAMLTSKLFIK